MIAALQRHLTALILELSGGDDGFHLAADIDQDLVPIDEHNRAFDKLTTAQLGVLRFFVLFEQRTHAHVLGVVAELRARLYVLSPGCCACLLLGAFRRLFHSVQKNCQPSRCELLQEYTGT